jgi:hypothetical protein
MGKAISKEYKTEFIYYGYLEYSIASKRIEF